MSLRQSVWRFSVFRAVPQRSFNTSVPLLLKKQKGGKKSEAVEPEVEIIDTKKLLEEATKKFDEVVELHQKKINEIRLGKSNPKIFDKLQAKIDGELLPFTSIAQTTIKGGRFLNVTVFDPSHTKTIVSTILASGLNMTPEVDKGNPQLLKVSLPPPTLETKKLTLKQLKENFENFKSNPHNKHCLAHVRTQYLKHTKKGKVDESIKKFAADFDKMQKKYTDALNDQFKTAEKNLLK